MPTIESVRPLLLSVPYADEDSFVVQRHLDDGHRTCGMIEVTLENGITGLGEGYIAKFAPRVFTAIAEHLGPLLVGTEAAAVRGRYDELVRQSRYWSREGAARQVISAFEIALVDAIGKDVGVPAHVLLGGRRVDTLKIYGSGGEGTTKSAMTRELDALVERGVDCYKIRASSAERTKAAWVLDHAAERDISVAIDLMTTGRSPKDVIEFVDDIVGCTDGELAFVEEPLDRDNLAGYRVLRERLDVPVTGGEAITSLAEFARHLDQGAYDVVQPDATVIGGMHQLVGSFDACRQRNTDVIVHCWGGPVCMMANYHAAFAGGGQLVEWPLPAYPLREEMMVERIEVVDGCIEALTAPGLGVELTDSLEDKYRFRESAVFRSQGDLPELNDDWRD